MLLCMIIQPVILHEAPYGLDTVSATDCVKYCFKARPTFSIMASLHNGRNISATKLN